MFAVTVPMGSTAAAAAHAGEQGASVVVNPDDSPQVTPTVIPTVTPTVKRLLALLERRPECGSGDIRQAFGLKDRVHVHKSYLLPAIEAGLIEMTIPDKPNSRLQKYRLTAKGKAILEKCA